jgi:hypothetical protein
MSVALIILVHSVYSTALRCKVLNKLRVYAVFCIRFRIGLALRENYRRHKCLETKFSVKSLDMIPMK